MPPDASSLPPAGRGVRHVGPALANLGCAPGSLPETERAARETLALPLWPAISREQQERVVECLRAASTVKAA